MSTHFKHDEPVETNRLDDMKQGVIGKPLPRIEGLAKTTGSAPYAAQVLKARGLDAAFDAIYGVEHAQYAPKPRAEAFDRIFALDGLDPAEAAMFEDDPRNLAAPHALGMRTVHVAPEATPAPHIHHHTDDLVGFLRGLR